MSKRVLPERGTEEYNRLVAFAALTVARDWSVEEWKEALSEPMFNYFIEHGEGKIGEADYAYEEDADWKPWPGFLEEVIASFASLIQRLSKTP